MAASIACPHCDRRLSIPESLLGKAVKCPKCQSVIPARGKASGPPAPRLACVPAATEPARSQTTNRQAPQSFVGSRRGVWLVGALTVGFAVVAGLLLLSFRGEDSTETARTDNKAIPVAAIDPGARQIAAPPLPPSEVAAHEPREEPPQTETAAPAAEEFAGFQAKQPAKKKKKKGSPPKVSPPAPKTVTPSSKPAVEPYTSTAPTFDEVPFTRLDGTRPLPAYLESAGPAFSDGEGLKDTLVRTLANDLDRKDFVLDAQFRFTAGERSIFRIGIGGTLDESVSSRVHGPGHGGYATLSIHGRKEKELARFVTPGPHIFRLEKRGDALTLAVGGIDKGTFVPIAHANLTDLKSNAPFLKRPSSSAFIQAGGGAILAVRFIVDGKPADAGPVPSPTSQPSFEVAPLVKLSATTPLPPFLDIPDKFDPGDDGIKNCTLRTAERDLINKNFVADVQFRFTPNEQSILHIGLGGTKPGGLGWDESITSRVHGPGYGGYATVLVHGHAEKHLPPFRTAGPHIFRLEKRGDILTLAIGLIEKGSFEPYGQKAILNVKSVAPFLTGQNSPVFVHSTGASLQAIRVLVEGKPAAVRVAKVTPTPPKPPTPPAKPAVTVKVAPKPAPVAKTETAPKTEDAPKSVLVPVLGALGRENLIPLAKGLPSYLEAPHGVAFDAAGGLMLERRMFRTTRTDLMKRDFTFDVVFRFGPEERAIAVVGIGPGRLDHNGVVLHSTAGSRLHGPGFGGYGTFTVSGKSESELGKYVTAGPHLFRLQKRGDVLTMAVSSGFKDKFVPTMERSLTNLKATTPFMNEQNSWLYFGGGGVVDAVRLVVDGEPIESRDLALNAPAIVVAGKAISQPLVSAAELRNFTLDQGPKGAQIDAAGKLAWTPAADQLGRHRLRVRASRGKETIAMIHDIEVVSADDAKLVGGDLRKIESLYKLPLSGDRVHFARGLDGKSLLLLDGSTVRRLVGNGMVVQETIKLPAACEKIAERADYFVALSDAQKALLFIDKKTLAVRRSVAMDYFRRNDIALNPTKPLTYVSVSLSRGDNLRHVFMIVDENSGEVHEPEGLAGMWLAVTADGKHIYTGEKQYFGSSSFDSIAVYEIRQILRPYLQRVKDDPGGNGNGIVLSPDGKRLSYLSFTGYPMYSKNIPAWDPTNLERRPVTYSTKEYGASCQWVAFHPRLELAAAPLEKGGAICYRRETGEALPQLVDLTYPPLDGVRTRKVHFAPDGQHLLLECEEKGEHTLRRVRLRLTAAELAAIKQ